MNKDTVIGIAGAVVLLAAMVGIFQYEGSQAESALGGNSFDVTWEEASENGPTASGVTPLGGESDDVVDLQKRNLTRAQFTVLWDAEFGENTLEVTITPPEGSGLDAQTLSGSEGELKFVFDVPNEVPEDATVFANGEEDAHQSLAAQHTSDRGTGVWAVNVAFQDASGVQPVPGGPSVAQDEEVDWEVRTILTAYVPELESQ